MCVWSTAIYALRSAEVATALAGRAAQKDVDVGESAEVASGGCDREEHGSKFSTVTITQEAWSSFKLTIPVAMVAVYFFEEVLQE